MSDFRPSVIIDIDGTLYDKFSRDDKNIVYKLFEGNILVKLLDKILWKVNSLDLISNSMWMLKLRIMIYCILSFKSYKSISNEYMHRYQRMLNMDLQSKENILRQIGRKYKVILVTNNVYALNVLYEDYHILYAPNFLNRREQIRTLNLNENIRYIIGNNYTDDIHLSKKLKIKCVYVGNSVCKKNINADYNISSFDEILKIIEDGS